MKRVISSGLFWLFIALLPVGCIGYYINPVAWLCVLCWYIFYCFLLYFKIIDL